MVNRFEKGGFSDAEQALISMALFLAGEQWRKDAFAVTSMAPTFELQIARAEKLRDEIGY